MTTSLKYNQQARIKNVSLLDLKSIGQIHHLQDFQDPKQTARSKKGVYLSNMYSPNSPVLSSLNHPIDGQPHHLSHCLRFKYFTTFLVSTTCLALLSASLATHKWIISKPIRILKLNGGQTNFTSLMLTAQSDQFDQHPSTLFSTLDANQALGKQSVPDTIVGSQFPSSHSNKFQGEIYFGLFKGVKVLNYGFGDRVSSISVFQTQFAKDNQQQQELINFKLWLFTLAGVILAILFALISSIFAIINFVVTPGGTLNGPAGLVIWNAIACFACLTAMVTWLIEYFVRLQVNVLTPEEVQNGWTSENRSHFGYSYYFLVIAFVLHLVNIFIVSIVQFESWTSNRVAKRQSRAACEGVIMLY